MATGGASASSGSSSSSAGGSASGMPSSVALPISVHLGGSSEVKPQRPNVRPIKNENTYVGYALAKIFSAILAIYVLLAVISLWCSEARMLSKIDSLTQGLTVEKFAKPAGAAGGPEPITKEQMDALTKSISEAYHDVRATTIEFHKTVIVNVLLPILTGLLGYIFGNREKGDPNKAD